MHIRFWRQSLQRRIAARQLVASAAILALVVGILMTSLLFARHAAAAPRQPHTSVTTQTESGTPRLETFWVGSDSLVYHRWSDDGGATWSAPTVVPSPTGFHAAGGMPAVVSDGVGRLNVFVQDNLGESVYKTSTNGVWSPATAWNTIPGMTVTAPGWLTINGFDGFTFSPVSVPAVSSWGPGHMDLFLLALPRVAAPVFMPEVILHTWADNDIWSGQWDEPAADFHFLFNYPVTAVSWGPGRIDVFALTDSNQLEHLWYDAGNGGWHPLENLGGAITSIPSAASPGPGRLNVFARGTNGDLWGRRFAGSWGPWSDVGCCLAGDVGNAVAAISLAPLTVDVFVIGTLHDLYRKSFDDNTGVWSDWQFLDRSVNYSSIAVAVWTPPLPTPTPTPTQTPTQTVVMPNLVSLDQRLAEISINEVGLVLGSVKLDNTCRGVEGTVVQQDLASGTVVPVGTVVNLLVSSGLTSKGTGCPLTSPPNE